MWKLKKRKLEGLLRTLLGYSSSLGFNWHVLEIVWLTAHSLPQTTLRQHQISAISSAGSGHWQPALTPNHSILIGRKVLFKGKCWGSELVPKFILLDLGSKGNAGVRNEASWPVSEKSNVSKP